MTWDFCEGRNVVIQEALDAKDAIIAELQAALEFYGDEEQTLGGSDYQYHGTSSHRQAKDDGGKRARSALAKVKEIEGVSAVAQSQESRDETIRELRLELGNRHVRIKALREALLFYSKGGNSNMDVWKHPNLGYFTGKLASETLAADDKPGLKEDTSERDRSEAEEQTW